MKENKQISLFAYPKPEKQDKPRFGKRKCKNCGKVFVKSRPLEQVCCVPCAIEYSNKLEEKKREKEWKARKKKGLEKLKTYSQRVQEARKVFQEFIRIRDQHKPCISCATTHSDIWDAGHFFKAELYSGLIFHEDNCHRQCRRCNRFLGGNESAYRMELVSRIGVERVNALEALKNSHRQKKWTDDELELIKTKSKEKIKYYKALYK